MTVQQDGAQPGEKLAAPIVTAQAAPRFHQGILCEVLGLCGIAAQQHRLSQQPGFIGPADSAERFVITGPGQVQQTPRVWGFDFHECWIQAEHISVIVQNPGQFHWRTVRAAGLWRVNRINNRVLRIGGVPRIGRNRYKFSQVQERSNGGDCQQ